MLLKYKYTLKVSNFVEHRWKIYNNTHVLHDAYGGRNLRRVILHGSISALLVQLPKHLCRTIRQLT